MEKIVVKVQTFLVVHLFLAGWLHCQQAEADVGQCLVLAVCGIDGQLDEKQQQVVGRRIMKAHEASSQSDMHMVFVCIVSRDRTSKEVLYKIDRTALGDGIYPVRGYRITAPTAEGVAMAAEEVAAALKQSRIHELKLGTRSRVPEMPLYEKNDPESSEQK